MKPSRFHSARRIVVRIPNWVGDVMMITPTLARLRRMAPEARIVAVGRGKIVSLLENNPDVDELWAVDDCTARGWMRAVRRLRAAKFDWGLVLPNSLGSALLLRAGGVRAIRGYNRQRRRLLLDEPLPMASHLFSVHEVLYYWRMLDDLAEPPCFAKEEFTPGQPPLVYRVSEAEARAAEGLLASEGFAPGAPFIALAPGAAYGTAKRWFPECYAEAAVRIAELSCELGVVSWEQRSGQWTVSSGQSCELGVVGCEKRDAQANEGRGIVAAVILGGASERDVCEAVRAIIETKSHGQIRTLNLAGRGEIRQTGAVLARAALLLTNDSGLMHLGAALGVPLVAVFGPTDWVTTAPWTSRARIVRVETECAPCLLRHCPIDHRCMKRVEPEAVVRAALELLHKPLAETAQT